MYRPNRLIHKFIKIFSLVMFIILFLANPSFAYTPEQRAQLDAIDQQNAAFRAQLDTLYAQERTIANEIAIADAQASALQAQINDTQTKINITNATLTQTAAEIKAAEDELTKQKSNLQEYMKVMYMDGQTSQIELILTSNNFSDFVDKSEYMNTMQNKVQETMDKIAATKKELEAKKLQLETDKASLDSMQEGLLAQNNALSSQIYLKNQLLSGNKNNQSDIQSQININNSNSYIIRCLASGTCGGSANGDLQIFNQNNPPQYYYFAQTDVPGTYYGSYSYAYYGCLITSLAMAHGINPTVEASHHNYNPDGEMKSDSTSGSSISWATANNILTNGGTVVMGLNIGHFVLAVGYNTNTGKYLINDPFPGLSTNGYDKTQVTKLLKP